MYKETELKESVELTKQQKEFDKQMKERSEIDTKKCIQ